MQITMEKLKAAIWAIVPPVLVAYFTFVITSHLAVWRAWAIRPMSF